MEKINWREVRKLEVIADGFEVKIVHRFYFHYTEGPRTMRIGIEVAPGNSEVLFKEDARWLPPFDNEVIPSERLNIIKERVHQGLDLMEIPHTFVSS